MKSFDVIIMGGGIMGVSTAFFLRRRGLSVIILERGLVGQQASGTNFGNVRRQGRPLHQLPLSNRARALWGRLPELIGDNCEFAQQGHMRVAFDEAVAERMSAYAAEARHYDLDLELLSGSALRARFPYLGSEVIFGSLSAADGHANPRTTTPAIARAAIRDGVHIEENSEVVAIEKIGTEFVVDVRDRGTYRAPVVVVTAGAWSGDIVAKFDAPLPLYSKCPQMGVTEPLPHRIGPSLGISTNYLPEGVYLRQVDRGNIVFGGGVTGGVSSVTGRAEILPESTLHQVKHIQRILPALANASIIRTWSGVEAYMPDSLPVLGPSARTSGIFYAFGFSGAGFQIGIGVGDVLAELIASGQTSTSIEDCSITRFAADPIH